MTMNRRHILHGAIAAPAIAAFARLGSAAPALTLKISHQFPGGTIDQGDFRDRLVRKFAAEVEKKTNGGLKVDIYPNSSPVKVESQFNALPRGRPGLALVTISYARGRVSGTNTRR